MYDGGIREDLARCLSGAFLAGVWDEQGLIARAGRSLNRRPSWMVPLVRAVIAAYPRAPLDRPYELARYIERTLGDQERDEDEAAPPWPQRWFAPSPEMGHRSWPVPEIASTGELARFLGVDLGRLAWFADLRMLERSAPDERLRNYRYGTIVRPGRPLRVIEKPKPRLKELQRRVLHEVLDWIPAHYAAHGFTRGRSVRSHANSHCDRSVVIRFDLQDFFASIAARRVYGIFRTAGYPEQVAHTLTGLCTNVIPSGFWASLPRPSDPRQIGAHHHLGRQLAAPHLPQGTPTSPALANLAAFNLDRRLTGLAKSLDGTYTRYADDLTFSGSMRLVRHGSLLRRAVADIACDEGFVVNESKSTLVTRAGRQQVCGVIVNQHPNISRHEYDRLKAILHNSIVHGPASQNRDHHPDFRAHLLGRISWFAAVNPQRATNLRSQFAKIVWES